MAHPNINDRRKYVQRLLDESVRIDQHKMVEIAKTFHCSHSAIRADILELTRDHNLPTPYVSRNMREAIRMRDAQVCQYCGSAMEDKEYIVEHVAPAFLGGVARQYNLVIACQSCNAQKGQTVWIPRNLDLITEGHPEWKLRILELADPNQPTRYVEQIIDPQTIEKYRKNLHVLKEQAKLVQMRKRVQGLIEQAYQIALKNPSIGSHELQDRLRDLMDLIRQIDKQPEDDV